MSKTLNIKAIPAHVAKNRNEIKLKHFPRYPYNGIVHFLTTFLGCSSFLIYCLYKVENPSLMEIAIIPISFLYANFCEYFLHRNPMHKPIPFLKILYDRHTLQHHYFYTHDAAEIESYRDFFMVLFPFRMLVAITLLALPIGYLLSIFATANYSYLFVFTAYAYFLNYELLHLAYHLPEDSWVGKIPFMDKLRVYHTRHHDLSLMSKYNFNITYPVMDWIFGTIYKEKK